jgi:predicted DNA-binding protein (UPF0278 family)
MREETDMLPSDLIAEYWEEVRDLLQKEHRLSKEEAWRGVVEYRMRLETHQVGDIIYHEDPKYVAKTIAGALAQGGFREPDEEGPRVIKPERRKKV